VIAILQGSSFSTLVVKLKKLLSTVGSKSVVWHGCDAIVAAAIEELMDRWGPYTNESIGRNLANLFGRVIGPAWSKYLSTLPPEHPARGIAVVAELNLRTAARHFGFAGVQNLLGNIALAVNPKATSQFNLNLGEIANAIAAKRPGKKSSTYNFSQTVESLFSLATLCKLKRPSSTTKEIHGINPNRGHEFCTYCGAGTEVRTFLATDIAYREKFWLHVNGKLIPKLSNKY
jgi:hypothetical protein